MKTELHASHIKAAILDRGQTVEQSEISMAHMHLAITTPRQATPAMRWGTVLHAAILQPETIAVFDGRRAGKAWADFLAEHPGKLAISAAENDRIGQARTVFGARSGLDVTAFARELSISAESCAGPLGGRLDLCSASSVWDLKTTGRISRRMVASAVYSAGSDIQMAVYRYLASQHLGFEPATFGLVLLESSAPWSCYRVELTTGQLDQA